MPLPDINEVGFAAWQDAVRAQGGIASGPPLKEFDGGWARLCFAGERGHYWQPHRKAPAAITSRGLTRVWRSLCHFNGTTHESAPALALGNAARCKHCQRQANKLRLR